MFWGYEQLSNRKLGRLKSSCPIWCITMMVASKWYLIYSYTLNIWFMGNKLGLGAKMPQKLTKMFQIFQYRAKLFHFVTNQHPSAVKCIEWTTEQHLFWSLHCYAYRSWIGSWMNSHSCAPNCELHPLIHPIQNPPRPGVWLFNAACCPWRPVHRDVSIITAPVMGIREQHVEIHTGSPVKPSGRPTANQTGWT